MTDGAPGGSGRRGLVRTRAPRLMALTDRAVAGPAETLRRFERLARAARPFSVMFQLRDRELAAAERLAFGRELRALSSERQQWFQVNDRCDLAALLGADAVHLGETSVSAADARRIVGPEVFVSRACHDPARELEPGVDAWVLSPIFAERKGRGALGLEAALRLQQRCRAEAQREESRARVFALGGVGVGSAKTCAAAGIDGVTVIGAVLAGDDVELLLEALDARRST